MENTFKLAVTGVTKTILDLGFGPMLFSGRIVGQEGIWFLSHIGVTRLHPNKSDDGGTGWEMTYLKQYLSDLEVQDFKELGLVTF